jgi:predicted transcriptional regulator of viral defense system
MKVEKGTIKRLKHLPRLFRIQDVEKLTPHAGIFLSRATREGLVHRINRGNYVNAFLFGFPPVEEVACFLKPPAYVSCEWAMHHHGTILQAPMVCTVVTLNTSVGKSRSVSYQGITLEFSKIADTLFFGYLYQNGFNMASPEKALLDTLYYRRAVPVQDELEWDTLDLPTLTRMAAKYPGSVCRKVDKLIEDRR